MKGQLPGYFIPQMLILNTCLGGEEESQGFLHAVSKRAPHPQRDSSVMVQWNPPQELGPQVFLQANASSASTCASLVLKGP